MTRRGLKERLQAAGSLGEVLKLMAEGATYAHVSEHTKRAWGRVAERRTVELQKGAKRT